MRRRVKPEPLGELCLAAPGKRRYRRRGHAVAALRRIQSHKQDALDRSVPLEVYKCRCCGHYHLGRPQQQPT